MSSGFCRELLARFMCDAQISPIFTLEVFWLLPRRPFDVAPNAASKTRNSNREGRNNMKTLTEEYCIGLRVLQAHSWWQGQWASLVIGGLWPTWQQSKGPIYLSPPAQAHDGLGQVTHTSPPRMGPDPSLVKDGPWSSPGRHGSRNYTMARVEERTMKAHIEAWAPARRKCLQGGSGLRETDTNDWYSSNNSVPWLLLTRDRPP